MAKTEKAVRGAAWTIGSSLLARLIGVGGTLMITRYLDPSIIGEVTSASIVVVSANLFSNFGLGNYAVLKYKEGKDVTFACTVVYMTLGVLALGGVLLFGHLLSDTINAPHMGQYIPGLVLATFIRRLGHMPDKVLAREMKFGAIGVSVTLGELTYAFASVMLAMQGWGGQAVVWANVLQSTVMTTIIVSQVHWREWLEPHKIRWKRLKDQANFGVPLGLVATAHYASTTWDNLIYSRFFGVRQMGLYNLAYGLATMPAAQIGDQVGSVLFPSMSNVDDEAKQRALIRSIGLMGLLVFPLGMGLFAIANPLVATLLTEEWQGVAPILAALSLVTALQPIAWAASSYLLSKGYNWALSVQEFIKLGALAAGLLIFGPFGPVWACAGVGVAAATQAAIFFYLLTKDKVPAGQLWQAMVLPLVPCIPMVAAVFGVHYGLLAMGIDRPILLLVTEIITGAVVFVPSAFMLCPAIASDFKELVMSSLGRRKSE